MGKKFSGVSQTMSRFRGWIQAGATLLTNLHLPNFLKGGLYQGAGKSVCVPGLNCYSCPAASGACPIGAFQAAVGSSKFSFSYYITGFLILLGVLLGRFICGFLCPFGWFQELLHKIPTKKLSTKRLKPLTYLKYAVLLVMVVLLPAFLVNDVGMGDPFFCKYLCPQGVLEGAIPLSLANAGIRAALGKLFTWKFSILLSVIALSVLFYRPFCKWLCPLGAFYALFNRVSLFQMKVDKTITVYYGTEWVDQRSVYVDTEGVTRYEIYDITVGGFPYGVVETGIVAPDGTYIPDEPEETTEPTEETTEPTTPTEEPVHPSDEYEYDAEGNQVGYNNDSYDSDGNLVVSDRITVSIDEETGYRTTVTTHLDGSKHEEIAKVENGIWCDIQTIYEYVNEDGNIVTEVTFPDGSVSVTIKDKDGNVIPEETTEPTEETTEPAGGTRSPTGETTEPTGETTEPTGETTESSGETTESTEGTRSPTEETTEPTGETTEPTEETTEPTGETTEPTGETTEPAGETTEPSGETTEPTGETTEPTGETTEPAGETTESSGETTESTEGTRSPTEGTRSPTEETTEPTGETTEPTESTEETTETTEKTIEFAEDAAA